MWKDCQPITGTGYSEQDIFNARRPRNWSSRCGEVRGNEVQKWIKMRNSPYYQESMIEGDKESCRRKKHTEEPHV